MTSFPKFCLALCVGGFLLWSYAIHHEHDNDPDNPKWAALSTRLDALPEPEGADETESRQIAKQALDEMHELTFKAPCTEVCRSNLLKMMTLIVGIHEHPGAGDTETIRHITHGIDKMRDALDHDKPITVWYNT